MNQNLFQDWLTRFNTQIAKLDKEKLEKLHVSLTIQIVIQSKNFPHLSNLEVIFLSPNTNLCMQLVDAVAMVSLKERYKRNQVE